MQLIMDLGMNDGRDSAFYLRKGFRVVAVEANPLLAERASKELARYVASGQLIIEHVGLAQTRGEQPFYVNLDNSHWSSFNKVWGTRNGTRYQEIPVRCITPRELLQKHGMPYYLKIDIEGNDIDVVRALHGFPERPRYISIEENEASYFAELWAVGCRAFKLVDQMLLQRVHLHRPAREGKFVDAEFDELTSGPFGEEAPGEWMPFDRAVEVYLTTIRSPTKGYLAQSSWFDIHGRFEQNAAR